MAAHLLLALTGCFAEYTPEVQVLPDERPGAVAPDRDNGEGSWLTDQARTYGVVAGLAIYDDDLGFAGMEGPTCEVDLISGDLGTDVLVDESGQSEVEGSDGVHALVRTAQGLYVYTHQSVRNASRMIATGFVADAELYAVSGVGLLDAGLVDGGLVAMQRTGEGCELGWMDVDPTLAPRTALPWAPDEVVMLDTAACASSMAVDPETGRVWLSGERILGVTPDAVVELDVGGDLLAWDGAVQRLYVAERGQPRIEAWTADGAQAFSATAPDGVVALGALGGSGGVVVVSASAAAGSVLALDGQTGALWGARSFSMGMGEVERVVSSPSGETLALVSDEARIFSVSR
ncbi:MAG: hypothetical protein H6739_30340 [Alphaproteobacteria bacterium]|nr:hypothetical protein [Alphaproteobacteria bacterium]